MGIPAAASLRWEASRCVSIVYEVFAMYPIRYRKHLHQSFLPVDIAKVQMAMSRHFDQVDALASSAAELVFQLQ